jgi:hypothetical protein
MKRSRRTLLQYVAAHRNGTSIGQKGRRAPRERPFFGLCFTSQSDVIKVDKGGDELAEE